VYQLGLNVHCFIKLEVDSRYSSISQYLLIHLLQVTISWIFNSTVIPRTEIPLDQSNCSSTSPSSYPCTTPPATPNSTCEALQVASRAAIGVCYTVGRENQCSTICDFHQSLDFPLLSNLTVLPCLDVPGVNFLLADNNTVFVNETFTRSRSEVVRVGPANVTLHVMVVQSADMSSIEVGVSQRCFLFFLVVVCNKPLVTFKKKK